MLNMVQQAKVRFFGLLSGSSIQLEICSQFASCSANSFEICQFSGEGSSWEFSAKQNKLQTLKFIRHKSQNATAESIQAVSWLFII